MRTPHAWVRGVARTETGASPASGSLNLQSSAASRALADAGLMPHDIQAVLVGYSTTAPHLMPAGAFAERFGIRPRIAFGVSAGGATAISMISTACALLQAGGVTNVLVVAGEDRASGQARDVTTTTLAGVGHPDLEAPLGATVPAYYGLLASRYLSHHRLDVSDLAYVAVQQRSHASHTIGAHFTAPITEDDVMSARMIADPLTLLQCCPMSDGGAAVVLSGSPTDSAPAIIGIGHANRHQHLSALDFDRTGAGDAATQAFDDADISPHRIDVAAVYDSFTVTLAMVLEEAGLVRPGRTGHDARAGRFSIDGELPTNTHGGLLSHGHSGVAGGLNHLVEVTLQLRHERDAQQVRDARFAYVHGEGGVLSAHGALVLRGAA